MTGRAGIDRIVIASHNAGKVREIGDLLRPLGIAVISAAELGLHEPAETEDSFAGNARIKAHSAARASGLPALADDSGLSVDALDGDPGVRTADWAETPTGRDFDLAMEKVRTALARAGAVAPFTARFHCTLCIAWPDGTDDVFEGDVEGTLTWPPRGSSGFGYDPIFLARGEDETFGEMDPDRKHEMSHRAAAFRKLASALM